MTTLSDDLTHLELVRSRKHFAALRGELASFLAGSEGVFLETGSRVSGLEQRAQALVAASAQAVQRGAGPAGRADLDGSGAGCDECVTPVQQLGAALARLGSYLKGTRDGSGAGRERLSRMLARAEAVSDAQREFEDLARTLRIVGMYIRIESSRSQVDGRGMETVAVDVRRLSDLIESRFQTIVDETAGLREAVCGARDTVEAFLGREEVLSDRVLRETRSALEPLTELSAEGQAIADAAVNVSEQVVRSVAGVLVALQEHDATRQIIEHALEELDAFEEDVDWASQGAPLDAGAWLAEGAELCRLAAAQLRATHDRYASALNRIAERLKTMVASVADLQADTGRLAGQGEGSASLLARVHRGVGDATQVLREHLARAQATAGAMGGVAATVESTTAHVRIIRGIGRDVHIIALNALVETERAGEGGRVLAVLGQTIGALAAEVGLRTEGIARELGQLASAAGELGAGEEVRQLAQGTALAAELAELEARLRSHHQALLSGARAVQQGSEALHIEVDWVAQRLLDQVEMAGALQRVEAALVQTGERAERLAGSATARRPVRGARALGRYTMAAERDVHRKVIDGADQSLHATSIAAAAGASEDAGLGDNVELF